MSEVPLYSKGVVQQHRDAKKGGPFRGGLVFKAHRFVYHSTLGWRVIKKKKKKDRFHGDAGRFFFSSSLLSLQVLEGP